MSAPFIWIILPLFVSAVLLVVRKNYRLAALIQAAFCIFLVLFLFISRIGDMETVRMFSVYIEPEFNLLGRGLILADANKFIIGLFYSVLAAWSVSLFIYDIHSKIVPLGLTLTALLLAAIAVEPFLYSALIVEIAVLVSIIIVVDLTTAKTKGIIRYLIFFTLGMPFILLAGWYLSGGETSPINEEQLIQATVLMGLGFVFWLSIFPFHSWIPLVADESETQDGLYVLTILPFSIFIILLKFLNGFVWLREYDLVYQALLLFGIVMVSAGSLWSVFQTSVKKTIGYLTITITGFILIALGLNENQGFLIFAELQLPRFLGYLLLMISLITIEDDLELNNLSDLRSVYQSHHFASAGLLVSLSSMIGMPLTAGFLPMQALYQEASRINIWITIVMLVGNGLLTMLLFRMFLDIMQPVDNEIIEIVDQESLIKKITITSLILVTLALGLIPNLLFPRFNQLMTSFEFLVK